MVQLPEDTREHLLEEMGASPGNTWELQRSGEPGPGEDVDSETANHAQKQDLWAWPPGTPPSATGTPPSATGTSPSQCYHPGVARAPGSPQLSLGALMTDWVQPLDCRNVHMLGDAARPGL